MLFEVLQYYTNISRYCGRASIITTGVLLLSFNLPVVLFSYISCNQQDFLVFVAKSATDYTINTVYFKRKCF